MGPVIRSSWQRNAAALSAINVVLYFISFLFLFFLFLLHRQPRADYRPRSTSLLPSSPPPSALLFSFFLL